MTTENVNRVEMNESELVIGGVVVVDPSHPDKVIGKREIGTLGPVSTHSKHVPDQRAQQFVNNRVTELDW